MEDHAEAGGPSSGRRVAGQRHLPGSRFPSLASCRKVPLRAAPGSKKSLCAKNLPPSLVLSVHSCDVLALRWQYFSFGIFFFILPWQLSLPMPTTMFQSMLWYEFWCIPPCSNEESVSQSLCMFVTCNTVDLLWPHTFPKYLKITYVMNVQFP